MSTSGIGLEHIRIVKFNFEIIPFNISDEYKNVSILWELSFMTKKVLSKIKLLDNTTPIISLWDLDSLWGLKNNLHVVIIMSNLLYMTSQAFRDMMKSEGVCYSMLYPPEIVNLNAMQLKAFVMEGINLIKTTQVDAFNGHGDRDGDGDEFDALLAANGLELVNVTAQDSMCFYAAIGNSLRFTTKNINGTDLEKYKNVDLSDTDIAKLVKNDLAYYMESSDNAPGVVTFLNQFDDNFAGDPRIILDTKVQQLRDANNKEVADLLTMVTCVKWLEEYGIKFDTLTTRKTSIIHSIDEIKSELIGGTRIVLCLDELPLTGEGDDVPDDPVSHYRYIRVREGVVIGGGVHKTKVSASILIGMLICCIATIPTFVRF
jgi:hypothetical protein